MRKLISFAVLLTTLCGQAQPIGPRTDLILSNNKHIPLIEGDSKQPVDGKKFVAVTTVSGKFMLMSLDSMKSRSDLFAKIIVMGKMDETIHPATSRSFNDIRITYSDVGTNFDRNTWEFNSTGRAKENPQKLDFAFWSKPNTTYLVSIDMTVVTAPPPEVTLFIKSFMTGLGLGQLFILSSSLTNVSFVATTRASVDGYMDGLNFIRIQPNIGTIGTSVPNFLFRVTGIRVKEL